MNGGIYAPENFEKWMPANVLGGVIRARTATRDSQGKFLSKTQTYRSANPQHGIKAGKIRASQAKRNAKGQYIKCYKTS